MTQLFLFCLDLISNNCVYMCVCIYLELLQEFLK